MIKNLDSKQIDNQTPSIVSTNNSWKEYRQTKNLNQIDTVSFVSMQSNHLKNLQKIGQVIIIMNKIRLW